jgi:hypothetical protein
LASWLACRFLWPTQQIARVWLARHALHVDEPGWHSPGLSGMIRE